MHRKLIWNDIKQNKLLSFAVTIFMAVSAMLLALTVLLFIQLLGSIDDLMEQAKTPDFLQMHKGELDKEEIARFADQFAEIEDWQVSSFLNLENSTISLGEYNLADSVQDNGLCVQGERFDYLFDMDNKLPVISIGEVYVPVCYRNQYDLKVGDSMKIGNQELVIAGFIRDSQMNSMMSSSKRFLVEKTDYEAMEEQGEEEFLIEFLMQDGKDVSVIESAYIAENLPANGPTITKPLIRMMNALSDGMMILVIFLISVVVLLISMLCIRFILLLRIEKDKKEIGLLKALGIGKREIRQLYFQKYILLSVCGAFIGLLTAYLIHIPLAEQIKDLYGISSTGIQTGIFSFVAVIMVEAAILFSIWQNLKKTDQYTALEALFNYQETKKRKTAGRYLFIALVTAACTFLMLLPQNLYSTLSSPKFVTYMGIGNGEIRIDVRQTEEIEKVTAQVAAVLEEDIRVEKYAVLQTKTYPAILSNGIRCNLTVETGNHTIFPVSYVEGYAPKREGEIALSTLNAKELGLSIGDTLQMPDSEQSLYRICGIYSDITNGGKTAKAADITNSGDDIPVTWSILYLSLTKAVSKQQWIEEYRHFGVDVADIASYVEGTYGQTLQQVSLALKAAIGISIFINFIVVTLFMSLIVERNRNEISLQKALGFTSKDLKKSYIRKGLLSAGLGIAAGILIGIICGESLCGMILRFFGADGFQFVLAWGNVFFLIPAIFLMVSSISIWTGLIMINKIRAFDCCIGKE